MPETYTIDENMAGLRLDSIVQKIMNCGSLTELRRNWGSYNIFLNGKPAKRGTTVMAGSILSFEGAGKEKNLRSEANFASGATSFLPPTTNNLAENLFERDSECDFTIFPPVNYSDIKILHHHNGLFAIYKPAGLHSTALSGGRGGQSLEDFLPELARKNAAAFDSPAAPSNLAPSNLAPSNLGLFAGPFATAPAIAKLALFNRLDCLTSGIVLATSSNEAKENALAAEQGGRMEKRYLALVAGRAYSGLVIKNLLDTDSRQKTKVLSTDNPNNLRHTHVRPIKVFTRPEEFDPSLAYLKEGSVSLVEVTIFCGARHQIRAHLSHIGLPIVGDPLYSSLRSPLRLMYLHHYAVNLPGFLALSLPSWGEISKEQLRGFFPGLPF